MFIESFHTYELIVAGVMIPKKRYTELELRSGKNSIIEVSDEQLKAMEKDNVFKALVNTKQYRLLDKMPQKYVNRDLRIKNLEEDKLAKEKEIQELKDKIASLEESKFPEVEEGSIPVKKGKK